MHINDNKMAKGFVFGFLAGGAVGAVLALLYAPKKGSELRAELKERADALVDDSEAFLQHAKEKSGQLVSEAKRRSEDLITDAKRKASSLIEDADKVITGAKQKTSSIVEEGTKIKNAVKAGVEAFKDERGRS